MFHLSTESGSVFRKSRAKSFRKVFRSSVSVKGSSHPEEPLLTGALFIHLGCSGASCSLSSRQYDGAAWRSACGVQRRQRKTFKKLTIRLLKIIRRPCREQLHGGTISPRPNYTPPTVSTHRRKRTNPYVRLSAL